MATWRRRAALDAWIDQVESLLQQGPRSSPEPLADAVASAPATSPHPALHPVPAERTRGWMSLRAG